MPPLVGCPSIIGAVKDLLATAAAETCASREAAFALLGDVEGYPSWYPDHVPFAQRLEPERVKLTLRGSIGPIGGEFKIHVSETREPPARIELRRLPKTPDDNEDMSVVWLLSDGEDGTGTRLEVELRARLAIPAFVPVGDIPRRFAREFVQAAARALDVRSAKAGSEPR